MPIYEVEAPDGSILEIEGPEGASDQQVLQAAAKLYTPGMEPPSQTAGPVEALVGGVKRFGSSALTALQAPLGAEQAAVKGIQRQSGITERPGASLEEVKEVYNREGLWGATKEIISQIPGAISEQAPFLASMAGGAKAGFALPVPPQFKPITAVAGALVAPFLVQSGSNIERQAMEQLSKGEDPDIALANAYGTAAVQASLDVVAMKLGLGRFLGIKPNKLATPGAEELAKRLAQKKLREEGILKTGLKGAGKTGAAEIPTEITQQLLERLQAGLPLTNDDAVKEYMEAGYAAGLISPLGSVSRSFEKYDANKILAEQEEKANRIKNAFGRLKSTEERIKNQKTAEEEAKAEQLKQEAEKAQAELELKAKEAEGIEKVNTLLSNVEGTNELISDMELAIKTKKPSQYFQGITNTNEKKKILKDLQNRKKAFETTYETTFAEVDEVTTDKTWANLGIGKTSKIRKNNQLNGLDPFVLEDNIKIRDALEEYLKFKGLSSAIEERVANYLNSLPRPDQLEIRDVTRTTPDDTGAGVSDEVAIRPDELREYIASTTEPETLIRTTMAGRVPSDGRTRPGKAGLPDSLAPYKGKTLRTELNKIGINRDDMLDVMGEPQSPEGRKGYYYAFTKNAPELMNHIESGRLDEFLPYDLRLDQQGQQDTREAYNYIVDKIRTSQVDETEVIPYAIDMERQQLQERIDMAQEDRERPRTPEEIEQANLEAGREATNIREAQAEMEVIQPPAEPAPTPRPGRRPLGETATTTFKEPVKKADLQETVVEDMPNVPNNNSTGGNGTVFNDTENEPDNYENSQKTQKRKYLDWFETRFFSSDAALNNAIRRGMQKAGIPWNKFRDVLFKASTSQALHAENVAHQVLELGGIEYDPTTMKFRAIKNDNGSWLSMVNSIKAMSKQFNMPYEQAEEITNLYLEAKRLEGVRNNNARLEAEIQALKDAKGDKREIKRLEDQIKLVHLNDQEIADRVNYINRYPQLAEIQNKWNATRESLVKFASDSGLYSPDQAQTLLDALDYVPFYRIQEEEGDIGPKGYSRGLLDFADPKRFKGSKRPVNNIIDNMERWISYTVRRGISNRAAINLKDAALEYLPDEARQVREIKKGRRQNTITIRENVEQEDGTIENRQNYYEFDDPLYIDAFTGMEAILIPSLKFMRPFTDLLRQTIVLNPLFSLSQLPQDAYGAMFTSGLKSPFKIPGEIIREFVKTLMGTSATREELRPFGVVGQRDYSAFASREDAKVAASMKKATLKDMFLRPFELFANASDNAVRQAVYNRTLLETGGKRVGGKIIGGNKDAALEKAFEIINFRRAGSSPVVSAGRQLIPFFGAYLQAQNVAVKTITGKGISPQEKNQALAVLASTATKLLVLSMIYSFLVSDDEGYEKLDPVVRNRRLILPGTDGLSIPLRNDVFTFFTKIMPENLIQRYKYEGIDDTKLMKSIRDSFVMAVVGPTPIPQAITPIAEAAVNYNFFTGRPIIGQFEKQLDKELQYSQSTSELARLLSDISFNTVSPKIFDHVIGGYLGYTAGLINLATNDIIAAGYGRQRPDLSGRDFIASIPGMSMFVSREFGTKAQSEFYELRDEVQTAVASFNKLKSTDVAQAREYIKDHKKLLQLKTVVNRLSTDLSKIRKEMNRVAEDPKMSPEQKQTRIKSLREMQERIYSKAGILREKAGF